MERYSAKPKGAIGTAIQTISQLESASAPGWRNGIHGGLKIRLDGVSEPQLVSFNCEFILGMRLKYLFHGTEAH